MDLISVRLAFYCLFLALEHQVDEMVEQVFAVLRSGLASGCPWNPNAG